MNIFYFIGLSLEGFEKGRKLRQNWKTFWSYAVNITLLFLPLAFTAVPDGIGSVFKKQVLQVIVFWETPLTVLVFLVNVHFSRRNEALFWKLDSKVDRLLQSSVAPEKCFTIWCALKQSVNFATLLVTLWFLVTSRVTFGMMPKIFLYQPYFFLFRSHSYKFMLFVDVLDFRLQQLKQKLSKKMLTTGELKSMKYLVKSCWKMSDLIGSVFGLTMVLSFLLFFNGVVYDTYNSYFDFMHNRIRYGVLFLLLNTFLTVVTIAKSCHSCVTRFSAVNGLLLSRLTESGAEAFALQLHHQSINFSPLKTFVIDHELIISVSVETFTGY